MKTLIQHYLPRTEFSSYEDFLENYKLTIPDDFNFGFDIVDGWAELEPEKPALVWCDDSNPTPVTYTFSEISRLTNKAANLFAAYGVGKGDRVMLMLRQRVEVWVAMVALHKLGAVCIPATYQLTDKDIRYRCDAAKVSVIVSVDDEALLRHIRSALPHCPTVRHLMVVGEDCPDDAANFRVELSLCGDEFSRPTGEARTLARDPMLIYFTSGTNGMPKMVLHDHTLPLGHIVTAKYWQRVENGGRHMTVADSGWAKFAWGNIYGQWICGSAIAAYDSEKFSPERLMRAIGALNLTTFCAPPTVYRFMIKEDLSGCDFGGIKHCCTAGEPLNPEVIRRFEEATGYVIHEGFGQSESSVLIANFPWFSPRPGSTGKPSPLYDIDILDENGESCPPGVVGAIVARNLPGKKPTGLFLAYLDDEAANARAFYDGWYDTGDTAWRDSDGYIWFVGRSDDIIKCSGYRIGPFEVENALHTHPSVLECAVTAAPDPVRGQVVKATVVLARGFTPGDDLRKELQEHVKRTTAPYKYPRIVDFAPELPKTTSGKIRRATIRHQDAAR